MELESVKIDLVEGVPTVTSRTIAEELGKRHDHVIAKIRTVLTLPEYGERQYTYGINNNKATEYLLDKDAFILLVMNYEGYNNFKRAYIKQFNSMLQALQNPYDIPQTYGQALQLAATQTALLEKKEQQLIEQKPKVDFYDQVTDSTDTVAMGTVAKTLNISGIGRTKLFAKLRELHILQKDNQPYQQYIDKGYFRVISTKYTDVYGDNHISFKTVVYPLGMDFIRKKIQSV